VLIKVDIKPILKTSGRSRYPAAKGKQHVNWDSNLKGPHTYKRRDAQMIELLILYENNKQPKNVSPRITC
jgi:hypothetical protein